MRRIYASTNPQGVGVKDGKTVATPGICAGMTAIWCLRMSLQLALDATKPGLQESIIAQFDYELEGQKITTLLSTFLATARLALVGDNIWQDNGHVTARTVAANGDGHQYLWGYPGHSIGAARRNGLYYIFDPDRGLYEFANAAEFIRFVQMTYMAYIDNKKWWLIDVTGA